MSVEQPAESVRPSARQAGRPPSRSGRRTGGQAGRQATNQTDKLLRRQAHCKLHARTGEQAGCSKGPCKAQGGCRPPEGLPLWLGSQMRLDSPAASGDLQQC